MPNVKYWVDVFANMAERLRNADIDRSCVIKCHHALKCHGLDWGGMRSLTYFYFGKLPPTSSDFFSVYDLITRILTFTHEVWYFAFPGLCPKFYDNKCMCFDVFASVCIISCFIKSGNFKHLISKYQLGNLSGKRLYLNWNTIELNWNIK